MADKEVIEGKAIVLFSMGGGQRFIIRVAENYNYEIGSLLGSPEASAWRNKRVRITIEEIEELSDEK